MFKLCIVHCTIAQGILKVCAEHGLYAVLDLHQDAVATANCGAQSLLCPPPQNSSQHTRSYKTPTAVG